MGLGVGHVGAQFKAAGDKVVETGVAGHNASPDRPLNMLRFYASASNK